jgi:DNA invertase Pin-like site-specific DNA recombinase
MGQGKRVGYIRVSTTDQNPDRQLSGVEVDKKFIEYASGKNIKRPQLIALLDYVREDDIVVVHSMDRLARNVKELLDLIDQLNAKKVAVHFVKEKMEFTGAKDHMSRMILTVMGAIAELERQQILERQREGIAEAQKKGKYRGGKTKMTPDKIKQLEEMLKTREPKSKIALGLGISRFTLYRYLEKIQPGAAADEKREAERVIQPRV